VISRHTREIKKFEDWLTEKSTLPLKFEKVSVVNSVKLKAGVMSSVPLSFFSSCGKGMVSIGFLFYLLLVLVWRLCDLLSLLRTM
jgi:hypothetical protein